MVFDYLTSEPLKQFKLQEPNTLIVIPRSNGLIKASIWHFLLVIDHTEL